MIFKNVKNYEKLNEFILGLLILSTLILSSCGLKKGRQETSDQIERSAIVNGKSLSTKGENSHSVVALISENREGEALCTGSIVSDSVILTAAHCVEGSPRRIQIIFGADIKKITDENIRLADTAISHPNWGRNLKSGRADLALVHFKGGLPTRYFPVTLADQATHLREGQDVTMIGYGVTSGEREKGSGKLRQTTTQIIGQKSPSEIVTDGESSSVCFGDSGGPAFIKEGNESIQWGVASAVENRACNEASIHTEIISFGPWIHRTINRLEE
jgi:secreted trypsin-like serine protease